MRVAYVTTYDASDVNNWSGLGHYIGRAIENAGCELDYFGGLTERMALPLKAVQLAYRGLLSKSYLRDREPLVLKGYARQLCAAMNGRYCDVIFSPGTLPITCLQTDTPTAFWTDATFAGMVDFYPSFSNLCSRSLRNGHQMEQRALSQCRLAIYASEWAARSAVQDYDVDPAKVKVVPFGANIECGRTMSDITEIVDKRDSDMCRLLLCGVDWHRKGADVAVEAAQFLEQQGVKTELDIVGCRPPSHVPGFVKVHGFVSKRTPQGRELLDRLFAESHFLILPSRAEAFGVVFAEASSFGLPSIAAAVGGIPTAVKDGRNGFTLPADADGAAYAARIGELFCSKDKYRQLAISSFREYENRLNWGSSGRTVRHLLEQVCA